MPLSAGDKLGPYEILSLLGKGGMGEVYRARDPKLNREVAIKVLPHALANDADYLARFQREAQTLAALNHPNIATIYGLEANAIVMELVEGATLQGPLPLAEALPLAKQIAEALEAAHDKGIIHRDLKPGNVKVTPEGIVKVLDFGLAKAVNERPAVVGPDSPTLTLRATETGVILGTAGYMSPEQAAGKTVDRRADIWSFGVVLYELLTGKRMFDGETVTHTLADVVRAPIDLSMIEDAQIRHLIGRCLDRNLKTRLAHIGEARIALETYAPVKTAPPAKASWWPWAAGALALGLAVSIVRSITADETAPSLPRMRLDVEIAPGFQLARVDAGGTVGEHMFAISPNGERIAITLRGPDGKARLYTRLLHQSQVVALAGTENSYSPFFSPAGDWIAFFAEGKLKKIPVEGGAAVTLSDAPVGVGASWGDDGNIVATLTNNGGLWRISPAGGAPEALTKLNPGEVSHRWPHVLPGSRTVLFTAAAQIGTGYEDSVIEAISLRTGARQIVQQGGYYPVFLPGAGGSSGKGHLLYLHQSTLFAVLFDPVQLAIGGTHVPLMYDVSSTQAAGGDFAFTPSGAFVYLSGKSTPPEWPISWIDRTGEVTPLLAAQGQYSSPRFSPDGTRLAYSKKNGKGQDIWVKDLNQDSPSRLTFLPGVNSHPVWTPDGKHIVFRSMNPESPGLYRIRSDGAEEAKRLSDGRAIVYPSSFSPDGKRLAVFQSGASNTFDIFTMPVETESGRSDSGFKLGKAQLFLGTPFLEVYPAFSPDGRWLAYASNESGTQELYVRPFPGPGGRWQVSTNGGRLPLWSRDGREILFQALDLSLMAASYRTNGNVFTPDKPRTWTDRLLRNTSFDRNFDLDPAGKRLVAFPAGEAGSATRPPRLTFLLGFFDEFRRKAPLVK
ncbi:MAG: hypothetical protein FJW32_20420 [Acidobacteria bacterium]|nr:hypothetical protein [Acidobacteriota bacterium]